MLAQGIPNKEIADKLHIAEGTVKNHVSNILGSSRCKPHAGRDLARRRAGVKRRRVRRTSQLLALGATSLRAPLAP